MEETEEGVSVMRKGRVRRLDQPTTSCPICFSRFRNQVLGSPDCCDHVFCIDCILKWATTNKECPVDRKQFENVSIIHEGKVLCMTVPRAQKNKRVMPVRYDFTTTCEVCESDDRRNLISCDSCDLAYHTYCLEPEFQKAPNSEWNCPTCSKVFKERTYLTKSESQKLKEEMKNTFVPEKSSTDRDAQELVPSSSSLQLLSFDDFCESDESDTVMNDEPTSSVLKDAEPLEGRLLISCLYKHRIIISDDGQLFYDMHDIET